MVIDSAQAREERPEAKQFWAEGWQEHHELFKARLLATISEDRNANAYCPRCRGRVEVRAPDPRAITDAISKWHELAGLRPKQDEGTSSELQVQRSLVFPEPEDDTREQ